MFSAALVFALLFPSVHAVQHFQHESTVKKCVHEHSNRHEITHEHNNFHHCFICGFGVNFANIPENFINNFSLVNNYYSNISNNLSFFVTFFKVSFYSLRGPPSA